MTNKTNAKGTKQISLLDRVFGKYHESRAHWHRGSVVNFHTASCGFVTPDVSERYLQRADRAAVRAKYHEETARKYYGEETK